MHSYGSCFKYTGHLHFALAALAFGLYLALSFLAGPLSARLSPLLAFTFFGAMEFAFDQWGWRLLTRVPGLDVYDFAGTYRGKLLPGAGGEIAAQVIIKQTWSHISIDFEAGAEAKSYSASIVQGRRRNGRVELIYNYYATGDRQDDGTRFDHGGTSMLTLSPKRRSLSGEYYTEQARNSFGALKLRRVSA